MRPFVLLPLTRCLPADPSVPGALQEEQASDSSLLKRGKSIGNQLDQLNHTSDLMLKIAEEPFLQRDFGLENGLVLGLRGPTSRVKLRHRHIGDGLDDGRKYKREGKGREDASRRRPGVWKNGADEMY